MRRDVVLQRARVEFLFFRRDGNGEQIAASAFADQPAETFEPRIARAEIADSGSWLSRRDRPWSCSFARRARSRPSSARKRR